jgi:hypothetical protein
MVKPRPSYVIRPIQLYASNSKTMPSAPPPLPQFRSPSAMQLAHENCVSFSGQDCLNSLFFSLSSNFHLRLETFVWPPAWKRLRRRLAASAPRENAASGAREIRIGLASCLLNWCIFRLLFMCATSKSIGIYRQTNTDIFTLSRTANIHFQTIFRRHQYRL